MKERDVDYDEVVKLARQIAPEIATMDELFNEVTELNRLLEKIPPETFDAQSSESKWKKIFKDDNTNKNAFPCLYKLVSIILSIPVSNAFAERVFSLMGAQWTKERNLLEPETVRALLLIRVNLDMRCPEIYNLLMNNRTLREQIQGSGKYKT